MHQERCPHLPVLKSCSNPPSARGHRMRNGGSYSAQLGRNGVRFVSGHGDPSFWVADSAAAEGDAVQDRPVQRLVDDLVLDGHGVRPLVFNAANLSRSVAGLYLEKSEKVQ